MKQFKSLRDFLKSEEFKNKDLSYCDLSNLDLSGIENYEWKGFKFFHTNFKNTNIRFHPHSLRYENDGCHLEYCDFTGCDLSYLDSYSFESASINGSCFLDTSVYICLNYVASFEETIFPLEMARELIHSISLEQIYLLELNSHMSFSSEDIKYFLNRFYSHKIAKHFLSKEKMDIYIQNVKKFLEMDKKNEGNLYRLFALLGGESFSKMDIIHFLNNSIYSKTYEELDLSSFSFELLKDFRFYNCTFKSVIMPKKTLNALSKGEYIGITFLNEEKGVYTSVPRIIIPELNVSSWQEFTRNRVGHTCFTKQTNLYLELGRFCNAQCSFCRNQYLEPCEYDLNAIIENTKKLLPYIDNIVIGGGAYFIRERFAFFRE